MTEATRPTLISLLLMSVAVAGLASFVESQRHAAVDFRGPARLAVSSPAPAPLPATRSAEPAPKAPPTAKAEPAPPSSAKRAEAPAAAAPSQPTQVGALPTLPVPKPRPIEPLLAKARKGEAEAQLELALAYAARGDYKHSAAWLREAAIAGVPEARLRLGEQYRLGRGLPADPLEAFIWTKSAAEQGLTTAQLALGDAYERGLGVPAMPVEAYAWYATAAAAGDDDAERRRDRLADSLSAADRNAGEARMNSIIEAMAPSKTPNRHLVAEIQRLLRAQGYDPGVDDGVSGEKTTEAIRRFQESKAMPVDGAPSTALLTKLRAAVRPPPPPPVE